jgi:CRISPR-associated protein Cmr3
MTWTLIFHPVDSVLFKDGRPFNQDDAGMAAARSLFPPTPETMMGAARVTLAMGQGWTGGDWSQDQALKSVLGDRREPGALRLSGPFVVDVSGTAPQPFFAAPHHLLLPAALTAEQVGPDRDGRVDAAWLRPGAVELEGDLADARLPDAPRNVESHRIGAQGWWLDHNGMAEALAAGPSLRFDHLRALPACGPGGLAASEMRVGLRRDPDTRTAEPGRLYAAARLRLAKDIALAVECDGAADGWFVSLPRLVAFGGEGRFAYVEAIPRDLGIEDGEAATLSARYAAILVTPVLMDPGSLEPGASVPGLAGTLVAAATGRGAMSGGWNDATRGPEPMAPIIPAGAVLFMDGSPPPPTRTRRAASGRSGATVGTSSPVGQDRGASHAKSGAVHSRNAGRGVRPPGVRPVERRDRSASGPGGPYGMAIGARFRSQGRASRT